ncbi:hypothetical protein ATK30_1039 [Amycolatopsis echigonensis]|uniref:Uncharacterized protein n=1 Tax=Amycolatopsis echigonensis TaxID=2576905 RepID=A0A2N3W8U7_9PSEU|nr:hypothetical protein [Amycolatopsis niigatensis]PKV90295.1 hypothetical protein ATK30_1039 [Amycolatopsis niigatensis]
MPRKGDYVRDFPDLEVEPGSSRDSGPHRNEWVVVASTATKRNQSSRIVPDRYACSGLAAELAQEWVEYVEAAGLAAGSVQSYRQAIASFCACVDNRFGAAAPDASLEKDEPDLARAVAAWERWLPSNFPEGSTRPSILAGAIRVLIRRRVEHPERPVADAVIALARAGSGVPVGDCGELDEFSRQEKLELVRTAWTAVVALEKRLAGGWELAAAGRHPDHGCWTSIPDLLWGLAHQAITPKDIHDRLPVSTSWPAHLRECIGLPDGPLPRTAKQFLSRWLVAQLWPSTLDLHAFRVLLTDATGRAPEEIGQLTGNDVEFVPNGVRLTLVKKRAQRRYYRSFTDKPVDSVGGVVETEDFRNLPRREPGEIIRRLMGVTERARQRAADPEGKLFVRAVVDVGLRLKFAEWNPEAPPVRFSVWLREHGVTITGKADIRRLRKSTKVEKIAVARGRIHQAADDHHEQTFRGHYAQGTTLRVISAEVINAAQQHWFDHAVQGPTVLAEQPGPTREDTERLHSLGLTDQQADDLMHGQLDMGVTHCSAPYDSPYSPRGELCAVAPLRCLECRNAWILPSQLPQLLLFADHLDRLRQRMAPARFTAVWGQSWTNLHAVLAERTEEEIALAREHIAGSDVSLTLPLAAHVEFDA